MCQTAQTLVSVCRMLCGVGLADRPGRETNSYVNKERSRCCTPWPAIPLNAWLLAIVETRTIGAFVPALLVVAIVLFVVGLLSGRRTLV